MCCTMRSLRSGYTDFVARNVALLFLGLLSITGAACLFLCGVPLETLCCGVESRCAARLVSRQTLVVVVKLMMDRNADE